MTDIYIYIYIYIYILIMEKKACEVTVVRETLDTRFP